MRHQLDWKEYAAIARRAAAEGCVLLRNEDHTLPARNGETVSIFGRIQFDYYRSGTGSGGMVNAPYTSSILDSLRNADGIKINEELLEIYTQWVKGHPFDKGEGWAREPWSQLEMPVSMDIAIQAAKHSDLAILIIGRTAGEDNDNQAAPGSYYLTPEEEGVLKTICSVFKRVAVLLNTGNCLDMKWVEKYHPQAVLYLWQGGMEGTNAAADILTGKVNPSGKLSDTIAVNYEDYPSSENFGDSTRNFYKEDIYVGYRYFETFAKEKVMYPFGYGLSYTTFKYKADCFEEKKDRISFAVTVTNTGGCDGKEVIQVYSCPPQGKLGKAVRNLIRFHKTECLKPGENERHVFTILKSELSSYDDSGKSGHKSCYVLEMGIYKLFAGSSVRDTVFAGSFSVRETQITKKLQEALAPTYPFQRIKPMLNDSGDYTEGKENTPLRSIQPSNRIAEGRKKYKEKKYTGNQGYLLADVFNKKLSLEEFLAQLTEEDLICMTRGEGMSSPKVTPGTAAAFGGVTDSLAAYGIPAACCADGPGGIRMDCGTKAFCLPNGTALACTFDTELIYNLFEMLGKELRINKIDMILGPGMNIHRNPLNGRNFEYFSEDPYLTGKMAAAELLGLHTHGVTGTVKHFACNNQEYKRHDIDSVVSERALREIYLKGYETAVKEGGAFSVMTTYGALNGLWTSGNYDLLTTVLREEWGFKGIVMTDWWAKANEEGGPASRENTAPMVRAQNDLYMVVADVVSNSGNDNTAWALEQGIITSNELLRNAANICRVIMRSPVMKRYLGRDMNEYAKINKPKAGNENCLIIQELTVDESICLNVSGLCTTKGNSILYKLRILRKGIYKVRFSLHSDSGTLAQMPMSVFINHQLYKTIIINGTDNRTVNKEVDFEISSAIDNYLKLYFGESGIKIEKIEIIQIS